MCVFQRGVVASCPVHLDNCGQETGQKPDSNRTVTGHTPDIIRTRERTRTDTDARARTGTYGHTTDTKEVAGQERQERTCVRAVEVAPCQFEHDTHHQGVEPGCVVLVVCT